MRAQVLLVLLALLAFAKRVRAEPLAPDAPFDHWCIPPVCPAAPAKPLPALKLPPELAPPEPKGYVEQRARSAIATLVRGAVQNRVAAYDSKPLRDLLRAVIAALANDTSDYRRARGLGTSALRAGLTFELEETLPRDEACTGVDRLDAIYEGLAMAIVLSPVTFTERTGQAPARCVATAKAAERFLDGSLLQSMLPPKVLPDLRTAQVAIAPAVGICDPTSASAAIDGTVRQLLELYDRLVAAPPANEAEACTAARIALRGIDRRSLEILVEQGLANVSVKALAQFDAAAITLPCTTPGSCNTSDTVRTLIEGRRIERAALRAIVKTIGARVTLEAQRTAAATVHAVVAEVMIAVDVAIDDASVDAVPLATVRPDRVVEHLLAKYDVGADGVTVVKRILGFRPSPWIVEGNIGVPYLRASDTRLVGDARLGYEGRSWGIVGHGAVAYYDLTTDVANSDSSRYGGGLDAWWLSGSPESPLRAEIRVSASVELYDTTYVPLTTSNRAGFFHDHDSLLERASLFGGLQWHPSERFALRALASVGPQLESYSYIKTDPRDPNLLEDTTSWSFRGTAAVWARWRTIPTILAVRLRAQSAYFEITRDTLFVGRVIQNGQIVLDTTTLSQLDVNLRGFLDADVVSFGGFVPALFGGTDYVGISGDGGTTGTFVPVAGLGITRVND